MNLGFALTHGPSVGRAESDRLVDILFRMMHPKTWVGVANMWNTGNVASVSHQSNWFVAAERPKLGLTNPTSDSGLTLWVRFLYGLSRLTLNFGGTRMLTRTRDFCHKIIYKSCFPSLVIISLSWCILWRNHDVTSAFEKAWLKFVLVLSICWR